MTKNKVFKKTPTRKIKGYKCLKHLTTAQNNSKKVAPVKEAPSMKDWFTQNCTQEFRSKHLAMCTEGAIKLATTMRGGRVQKSTVIVLDSDSTVNAFKSIELKPKESYTLNVDNMVISTIFDWELGSGSVLLKTNEKSKIYHLENTQIENLKESKKVAQGTKIKF